MRARSSWHDLFVNLIELLRWAFPTLIVSALVRPRKPVGPATAHPRILVTRLDRMGDFIVFASFLRELRRNYPNSDITLVAGRHVAPLAVPCPYVDEVLILAPPPNRTLFLRYSEYLFAFAKYMKYLVDFGYRHLVERFDIAIQPCWWADRDFATLITFLSGSPRRLGYSERACPDKYWCNFGHDRLFTDVLPPGIPKHESERSLDIIRYLGGSVGSTQPEIWWRQEDQLEADRFFSERRLSEARNLIAFGLGASNPRRHWPFYGELIRLLDQDLDFVPLLLVGDGEEQMASEIADASISAVLMPQMPLGVVASVLSRCTMFIGNDSGPMHLASAVGLPVVEISCHPLGGDPAHVNSPVRIGSLAAHRAIIQPKEFLGQCEGGCIEDVPHCITRIRPEEVALQARQLLASIKTRIA